MTNSRSHRPHRRPAGHLLQAAALASLDRIRAPLADPALEPAEVIHDIRKALKRWRALLRVLSVAAGDDAKRLRAEARDLARAVGGSRDAQSALDALADALKAAPEQSVSERNAAAMRRRLTAVQADLEREQLDPALRRQIADAVEAAEATVRGWPLKRVSFDDIARHLTKTYRRARRMVPGHWRIAPAPHLHELRQRVVDLQYQLEFAGPLLPGLPKRTAQDARRLRLRLGQHQDLTLLAPLMAPRQPLARWRADLVPLVDARRLAHVDASERIAGRLLSRKPKAFRRKLRGRWREAPARTSADV